MADLIKNKKIHFNYEILEEFEAGIELLGTEVKSLRRGRGSLNASHITIRGNEAFLIGTDIPPYQPNNSEKDYDSLRNKRILLTKKEIEKIAKSEKTKGLTVVPISVYNKGSKLKVRIAIVRGKREIDKREKIKKRDTEREIGRTLKNRR